VLVESEQGASVIRVAVAGDLKGVQENALRIARGLPLPHDNCARNGPNVVIDSIDDASITPHGNAIVMSLSGHVTVWACAKVLKQKVKTPAASDQVTVSIPVELEVANNKQIRLKLSGTPTLATRSGVAGNGAQVFLGDVNARLAAELGKVLDIASARAMIPPLPGLDASIEEAHFVQKDSNITVQAKGTARMTNASLTSMLQLMNK
jgi:hypothetical protein